MDDQDRQSAASTALRRSEQVLVAAAGVCAERHRVERSLHHIGLTSPASQGNFVWLPLGTAAAGCAAYAGRNGVSDRPFDGEGVRVTIGARHDMDRFLQLITDFMGAGDARPSGRDAGKVIARGRTGRGETVATGPSGGAARNVPTDRGSGRTPDVCRGT